MHSKILHHFSWQCCKTIYTHTVPGVISERQSKVQLPDSVWILEASNCDESSSDAFRADDPLTDDVVAASDPTSSSISDKYDRSEDAKSSFRRDPADISGDISDDIF